MRRLSSLSVYRVSEAPLWYLLDAVAHQSILINEDGGMVGLPVTHSTRDWRDFLKEIQHTEGLQP